jgi:hypothetical protein
MNSFGLRTESQICQGSKAEFMVRPERFELPT